MNIKGLKKDQEVKGLKVLVKEVTHYDKENGNGYFKFIFTDAESSITGTMWSNVFKEKDINNILALEGTPVEVDGKINEYKGYLTLNVTKILKTLDDKGELIPQYPQDEVEKAVEYILQQVNKIKNPVYSNVVLRFFSSNKLKKLFSTVPAGLEIHHNKNGGLAIHTAEVLKMAQDLATEEMDKDLIIAGAILHDIGKIKEYVPLPAKERTICGHLQGHICLGHAMVYNVLMQMRAENVKIEDIEQAKLLHCILASHKECGPMMPMFPEAEVISSADEISCKINAMYTTLEKDKSTSENFTNRNFFLERRILKK